MSSCHRADGGRNQPVLQPRKLRPGDSPEIDSPLAPRPALFLPPQLTKVTGLESGDTGTDRAALGEEAARRPQHFWPVQARPPEASGGLSAPTQALPGPQEDASGLRLQTQLPDFKLNCPPLVQTEGGAPCTSPAATLSWTECLWGARHGRAPPMLTSSTLHHPVRPVLLCPFNRC